MSQKSGYVFAGLLQLSFSHQVVGKVWSKAVVSTKEVLPQAYSWRV